MPQNKKHFPIFGIQYAAALPVAEYLSERPGIFIGQEILKLLEIAAMPGLLSSPGAPRDFFAHLFATKPDEVIAVVQLARRTIEDQKVTQHGRALQYLLTHPGEEARLTAGEIAERLGPKPSMTPDSVTTAHKEMRRILDCIAFWKDPKKQRKMQVGPTLKIRKNPRMNRGKRSKMIPIEGFPKGGKN
jgi:hypothetical protein